VPCVASEPRLLGPATRRIRSSLPGYIGDPQAQPPGYAQAPVEPDQDRRSKPGRRSGKDGLHHTRLSGAWTAVAVAVVLGVALIDFIVQNTHKVRIEFFGADGHMPVAVALLAGALAGAFVVLAVGIARTTQLRLAGRRLREADARTAAPAPLASDRPD
jgi:uncharacterized integral membrane protein